MNSIKNRSLDGVLSNNQREVDRSSSIDINPAPTYLPAFPLYKWQFDSTDPATFETIDADIPPSLDSFRKTMSTLGALTVYPCIRHR